MNSDKRNWQLLSLKKSHVSHHIIFITAYAQNALLQHKRKRIDVDTICQQHVH